MKKRYRASLSLILAAAIALLTGCTNKISEKDNGKTVDLKGGSKFFVRLEGNPTTGYNWKIKSYDKNIIEQVGEVDYVEESDKIGAGGHYTFNFKALSPGQTKLELIYLREWEKDTPPIEAFEVTLKVK
ncbi:MAG: protease inhibitor I42 family protein [Candidatus Margulisbacteria bacterium]|nr:protease inhibitor I42 family protein [Candidatus Margulisiibacteriota bacterium]